MRNLDESRRPEKEPVEKQAEIVPFEQRTTATPGQQTPLLAKSEVEQFQSRWNSIQAGFVDEPRKTIEEADKCVANAMQRISQLHSDERVKLESMWKRGDQASTEDMRLALQRYRAFFSRLMSM
jgi:hypothetical protein